MSTIYFMNDAILILFVAINVVHVSRSNKKKKTKLLFKKYIQLLATAKPIEKLFRETIYKKKKVRVQFGKRRKIQPIKGHT
jgi:hypothetical protein